MSLQQETDQKICNEMVTKIAKLAKLRLTEAEASEYQSHFTKLLEMFHTLDELAYDESYKPERLLLNAEDCREDVPKEVDLSRLEKASDHYNSATSYFDVPQFIGQDNE